MSVSVDALLQEHGVISVKWIKPHFDAPLVTMTAHHVHSVVTQFDQLQTQKVDMETEVAKNEAIEGREEERQRLLKHDLTAIQSLVEAAHSAIPPLHDMQGFLEAHKNRLSSKMMALQSDLTGLELRHKSLLDTIKSTKANIQDERSVMESNFKAMQEYAHEVAETWIVRDELTKRLESFAKEFDRTISSIALYEAYLLHKYKVLKNRLYNSSRQYFVEQEDNTLLCSYKGDAQFCGERSIECRTLNREDLLEHDKVSLTVSSHFLEAKAMKKYEMVLFADGKTTNNCMRLHLDESMTVTP